MSEKKELKRASSNLFLPEKFVYKNKIYVLKQLHRITPKNVLKMRFFVLYIILHLFVINIRRYSSLQMFGMNRNKHPDKIIIFQQ